MRWTSGEEYVFRGDDGLPIMVPAYDPVLEDFVGKHAHGYREDQVVGGLINVWLVDQNTWDTMDVVTKVRTELQKQTGDWYAERNEYQEAAVKCYNDHGNPDLTTGCRDYLDDSKRIGPATYPTEDGPVTVPPKYRQYMCYVCPFSQAYVNVELRRRKGLYK
jgi:hypothetical protein